jgi:hypothetical protein
MSPLDVARMPFAGVRGTSENDAKLRSSLGDDEGG